MWRVLSVVLVVPIAACVAVSESSRASVYGDYLRYREAVNNGSVFANRTKIFAPSILNDIDIHSEKEIEVLTWGGTVVKEHSHYEKEEQGRRCLTVNGYADNDGKPVSLFIEYENRLVKFQHLDFPDRKRFRGFFEKALCPDEAYEEIMRKSEPN